MSDGRFVGAPGDDDDDSGDAAGRPSSSSSHSSFERRLCSLRASGERFFGDAPAATSVRAWSPIFR